MARDIQGLTVIFTGNGKGKTSAALGVVFRALGHGFKCRVIQFIKGSMDTGELHLAARLAPELSIVQTGLGFTWKKEHAFEQHVQAARKAIEMAREDIASGAWDVVLLDEILYALNGNLITLGDIEGLIAAKPEGTHLILTGRGAPPELIEKADMVTSMEPVKHPISKGIPAQKGLDF